MIKLKKNYLPLLLILLYFLIDNNLLSQPLNDDCNGAVNIITSQKCNPIDGDFTSAKKSNLPNNSFFDVWYKFTATTTTHYVNAIGSGDFRAGIEVFSGNCTGLTSIGNFAVTTANISITINNLTIGQTYYYRVYQNGNVLPTSTSFQTCVENYILNNECSGAETLTPSNPGDLCDGIKGKTSGATQSIAGCVGTAKDDVWYKFQATSTIHFVEVTGSSNFNAVVQFYNGDCNNLTNLNCINNTANGGKESVKQTGLTIGNWYYVRIYHFENTASTTPYFTICVTTPPANDECDKALEVKYGTTCTSEISDGTYATQSLVAGTGKGDAGDDVWFKFIPDTTVAFISVQPSIDYNPVVQLFTACGTPATGLSTLYDDVNYGTGVFGTVLVKGLTKGSTYYYRVYDQSNVINDMMSFTTCVVRPTVNDECINAINITPSNTCKEIEANGTYTTESTPATGGKGTANDDLWYKFTATGNSHYLNINASLKYDPVVQLFSGCMTPTTGSSVFYDDASFTIGKSNTVKLNGLTIGNTYYYRVYDKESTNPQTMTFTTCVTNAPINDDCTNATLLFVNNTCDEKSGNGMYASTSSEAPCLGGVGSNNDDIWYKFSATSTKAFISVTPDDKNYDPIVQVFSACGTTLNPAFCDDNSYDAGKFGTALVKGLTPGSTYYYRVYDKSTTNLGKDVMTINTCVVAAVENDDCTGALNVTPGNTCSEVVSDGTYATESLVKGACGTAANDDIWFKFTATNDSLFLSVTPKDQDYDPVVEVFSNCPTAPLPNLMCDDNSFSAGKFGTKILTGLTVGSTYYYRVYDKDATNEDTMEIATCIVNPVSNDNCIGAINIIPSNVCNEISAEGTYATQSFAQCTGNQGTANDDVWFKFTATTTKENISIYSSKFYDPVVEVYSSCNTAITPAICSDGSFPVNSFGTISINTTPNTTYYYRVYDKTPTGNYPLTFTTCVAHSPTNDDCSGATLVTSGSTCSSVNGDGTYATKSAGTVASCNGTDSDDIWFKFTATNSNQNIYIDASENYNPVVQLYSSCSATPTPFPAAATSCNDLRYPLGGNGSNTFNGLTIGNTYYYRVYDSGNTIKTPLKFTTCVTNPPTAPVNDNPCKAIFIPATLTCNYQTFTNEAATGTTGVTSPTCGTYNPNDVWFKTVVPFSGEITIDTKALTVTDAGISIFKGNCSALSQFNCDNDGNGKMAQLNLKNLNPGDTIWIRVWSEIATETGSFGFCITKPKEAPLVNGCSNLSFQDGTTSWFGTTGDVYKITGVTDVPSPFYKSSAITNTGAFFNVMTSGTDPICGFPLVPTGYSSSLKLGDGTGTAKKGASIEQYFKVEKSNANFIYNYAVVFQAERTGQNKHDPYQQPFFKVEVFDDEGKQISCGDYLVGAFSEPGFIISPTSNLVTYKSWTKVSIDLTNYIGKSVHVRYTTGDCTEGGHYGYAYITCNCSPFEIIKPAKVCVGDTAKLYGPKGAQSYVWKDPNGQILSTKDSLYVKATTVGKFKYTLDVTMFGTSMCENTLDAEIEVGSIPNLIITDPDTVCSPSTVDLTNTNVTIGSTANLVYTYWNDQNATDPLTTKSAVNTSGTYYIKGAKSPTCLDIKPVKVVIEPLPKIAPKTETICSEGTFTITPNNTSPLPTPDVVPIGTKYKWIVVDNPNITGESSQTIGQTNISQKLTNTSNSAQTVTYTVTPYTSSCEGAKFTVTVTVNPQPKIADKTTTICTDNSFEISPTNTSPDVVPSGTTYTWTFSDNTSVTNEANSTTDESSIKSYTNLLNGTNTVQTVEYTVTPKSGTCIGSNFKVTVKVNPAPKIPDFSKNICTGSSFDATPVDNGTTKIIPAGTNYTWVLPLITGGVTGSSAETNSTTISQTLTNPTTTNQTVTYSVKANTNSTPNCSSTFKVEITIEPKIQPNITCGTSNSTSLEFTWDNITNATSYDFEYKIGTNGTATATQSLAAGTTSKTITGLTAGNKVYFTLTPVGILCPLPATKLCSNCSQPTIVNNNITTPSDFDICIGEKITLKASETPTNATQWLLKDNTIMSSTIQASKNLIDITGLKEGKSDVEFTNDAGCTNSIEIKVNPKPIIANITKTICSGDKFEIIPDNTTNTIPSGTTYTWTVAPVNGISGTNNETTAQPKIVQTLTNSTNAPIDVVYNVSASVGTSPNNCTNTFTITVTVNPKPVIADMNSTICSGSAFTLSPTNGNGNIVPAGTTYTWTQNLASGITGNNDQSVAQNNISETLTNTTSADVTIIYTITATSVTCTNTFKGNVIVKAKPYVENKTDLICSGSSFSLTPTTSGNDIIPTGTTFKWTVPNVVGLTGFSDETSPKQTITQSITNTTSSVLTLIYNVTASVGTTPICTSTFTETITVNPKPSINQISKNICSEETFDITPTDGNGNIVPVNSTFTWTTAPVTDIIGNIDQTTENTTISQTLNNKSSVKKDVTYKINVKSKNNNKVCESNFDGIITVYPKPLISQNPIDICTGNIFTISPLDGNNNNIVPIGTTYTWTVVQATHITGGNNQTNAQNTISETLSNSDVNTEDATYTITAKTNSTPICSSDFNAIIHINPKPKISTQNLTICSGSTFNCLPSSSATDVVPSGTKYTWTVNNTTGITGNSNETNEQTSISQKLTNTKDSPITITYKVKATVGVSPNICSYDFDLNVTVNPIPKIAQKTATICSGETFKIEPVNNLPLEIVPTNTTYTWTVTNTNGTTGSSSSSIANNFISQTITNTTQNPIELEYNITASISSSPTICTSTFIGKVMVNPLPDFTPTATPQCVNDPLYLEAHLSTAKKVVWTGPNSYSYTALTDSKITAVANATSSNNGTYSVEVTDANGCINTKTVAVSINPLPTVSAGADKAICIGDVTKLNGAGADTYQWDNAVTDNTNFSPTSTKTYTVIGTDSKGCKNSDQIILTVNPLPTIAAGNDKSICIGESTTLSGTGGDTYTWDNNVVNNTPFSPTSTSDYKVTGTDTKGCKNTDVIRVFVNQLPDFTPTATSQCEKDPLYVQANFANAKKVVWSGPNGFANTSTTDAKITAVAIASISDNGNYTVEVTDVNDCKNTKTVAVTINPLPNVSAGPDKAICLGDVITLSGTGANSYVWDNNVTNNTNFSPTATKTYTVIGKDAKGCVNSDKVDIVVNVLPDFTLSVNDPCEQQTLTFSVDLTSNPSTAGVKTSSWTGPNSFNATSLNPSITPVSSQASGEYKLVLTDNNNCQRSKTINAFVNPIDNILFADINPKCVNNDPFFLPVPNIIGGTWSSDDNTSIQDPYTGLFDPAKSKPDELFKVVVTYSTETIMPKRKCPNTKSKVVFVNPIPDSNFYALNPVLCIDDTLHLVVNKLEKNVNHLWDLGNGVQLNSYGKLDYVYPKDGDFTIKLFSNLGDCKVSRTIDNYIHVIPKPTEVDFSQSANEIDFYNPDIQFNSKTNGKYLLWNFGDGTFSNYKNPSHKFPEKPGEYIIELTASNMENNYCSKTVVRSIFMPEPVIYFIPNTFTPNGDEINNVFQPIFTYGYDPQNYSFYIYNRWGELVFESHDAKYGWDGTYGDNLVANDTYIWKLEFKEKIQENKHVKTGHVNVLR